MLRILVCCLTCFVTLQGIARSSEKTAGEPTITSQPALRTYETQGWLVQESATFRVYCRPGLAAAKRLPAACEALRTQLQETWFGSPSDDWSPRCDIVVHPSVNEYVRELGPASRQSSGCASVDIQKGKVTKRRVDLRADADDWMNTALPHELTHVILAEKFTTKQIPRWADEGMAILTEPAARQSERRRSMQSALARSGRMTAGELMSVRDYPAAERRDAFYGESASLVAYLIERDSPARFLEFLQTSEKQGFDQALSDVYRIRSSADLDSQWRPRLLDRGASAELLASRVARITAGQRLD
jgi:Peptidase MA superfamily